MKAIAFVMAIALTFAMSTSASAATNPSALSAVQSMLYARTAAIVANDRSGYERTIDPEASAQFRSAEMKRFEGLTSLPLTGLLYQADEAARGDLSYGLNLDAQYEGSQETYLPETSRSYRLSDFDTEPQVDSFWYTYVKRDGRWYVAADDDVADLGLRNDEALWDFGAVATTTTSHFLVISTKADADRAKKIGGLAEEALKRVQANWSLPWSEKVPVIVPANSAQATKLLRSDLDVSNFVAFASYTPLRDGTTYAITAPRIFTQEEQLARQSSDVQIDNLAHELTHIAAAHSNGPFTPLWLQEGTAEFVRLGSPANYTRAAGVTELPTNATFSSGSGSLTNAYRNSASATAYIAATYGPRSPETFLQSVGKARIVPGTPAYNINSASIQAFGVGIADVQNGWLAQP